MKIDYVHSHDLHNESAAREVLPFLITLLKPASVVDIGCGTGSWLKVAKDLGVARICGIDGIKPASELFLLSKENFEQADLSLPIKPGQRYDLAICLEVAEHLPASAADTIVETLANHSDTIVFSAAIPGQGGQAHLNEQRPQYWQEKFEKVGYLPFDILRSQFWENPNVEWWYKQNMLIYANTEGAVRLNSKPVKSVLHQIHPELFELKMKELNFLYSVIRDKIWFPKVGFSFRLFAKSIVNVFKR